MKGENEYTNTQNDDDRNERKQFLIILDQRTAKYKWEMNAAQLATPWRLW